MTPAEPNNVTKIGPGFVRIVDADTHESALELWPVPEGVCLCLSLRGDAGPFISLLLDGDSLETLGDWISATRRGTPAVPREGD